MRVGLDALVTGVPAGTATADHVILLDGLLISSVRADDLTTGAAVLRTALLLHHDRRSTVTGAIDLVLLSMHEDGGFGGCWRDRSRGADESTTVDCAWSLAEYHRPGVSASAGVVRMPLERG